MSKKKSVKVVTSILCVLCLVIGFLAGGVGFVYLNFPESDIFVNGDLEIHFIDLGSKYTGDSIYIKSGNTDILIDAGSTGECSTTIINYVDQFVEDNKLEYVIATHSDQDHISAFYGTNSREGVLDYFAVDTIIDFPMTNKEENISNTNTVLGKYCQIREQKVVEGAKHYTALECYNNANGAKRTYQISESVEMEILYNYYYENKSSDENNYSVCLMFNQGDNHYLFTGDLEGDGEKRLVNFYEDLGTPLPKCVLYKAGHHGSKTSSSALLMAAIEPQYVVVCCCAGTSQYTDAAENQFPTQQFIDNVAPYTDKIYIPSVVDNYVDKSEWSTSGTVKPMNGTIVFSIFDGNLTIDFGNNDLILKETDWFKNNRVCPSYWL